MVKIAYKVYGSLGHRQRESFNKSFTQALTPDVKMEVLNSDKTGTNEYTEVIITAESENLCDKVIDGQISDGLFENCRTGYVEKEKR